MMLHRFAAALAGLLLLMPVMANATILTIQELEALTDLRYGRATEAQRALLFSRNDAINKAALRGYITDDLYQRAQKDFAGINQHFARNAAIDAGAEFRVQTSTSATYSPGTDSDYITKISRPEQVTQMQDGYNRRINKFLEKHGVPGNRPDWHVQLDTDFMADPSGVSQADFEKIAKLNNDAYRRREAALYEAVSRADDGTLVKPELYTNYAEEMKDFTRKKQKMLARMRKDPRLLTSPNFQAEFQRIMAQEQKYISRIESSNALLRQQRGLPAVQTLEDAAAYTIRKADDGTWRMVRNPTIAKQGSRRAADAFRTTAAASSVSRNSMENALERLAQSMAEAGRRDPDFARAAAKDIATLLSDMPASRKADFIEMITRTQGRGPAREIVTAMRAQHRAAVKVGRESLRAWSGRMLGALASGAAVGWEVYQAGAALKEIADAMAAITSNTLTAEQEDAAFKKAEAAAQRMAIAGGMGAFFEAFPQVGLAMGEFAIVAVGTRWVLENTETGRIIDMGAGMTFDQLFGAAEKFGCEIQSLRGMESDCERLKAVERNMVESVLKGIREGRWQLAEGRTMRDVMAIIRSGKWKQLDGVVVPSDGWKAAEERIDGLNTQLAALRKSCAPGSPADANGSKAANELAQSEPAVKACQAASSSLLEVAALGLAIDELSKRSLNRLSRAETRLATCRGGGRMESAFAEAQAASSDAANAARGFGEMLSKIDNHADTITAARQGAKAALKDIGIEKASCTQNLNDLIDAASAAHGEVPFKRLKGQIEAVQTAVLDIAEARGNAPELSRAAALGDCTKLDDPYTHQLEAMKSLLTLEKVPDRRRGVESAALECRDQIAAHPPAAVAPPPAATINTGTSVQSGGATKTADPQKLQSCLCGCNQKQTNFSCTYNTTDKGWSPSCANLSNGPCICKANGCFRAQPVTSGACAMRCQAKYGG